MTFFTGVGIWVFDVKTRIYCQGVKNLNRTPKNACLHEGGGVILAKIRECWRLVGGRTRCLILKYMNCKDARKRFTKKISNKK